MAHPFSCYTISLFILSWFEIIFLSFISSLFLILAFLIFTASDGINQLLNKKGVPYLFGFYYSGVLLSYSFYIPSSYQISALRDFWGTASYFIVFLFPVVFLLYMTLYQHWKKEKSLNEALYSFHYTFTSLITFLTGCGDSTST